MFDYRALYESQPSDEFQLTFLGSCNLVRIGFMASEELSFENGDERTACLYYKLTYEPSAQVR